jgi:hypothetical protein
MISWGESLHTIEEAEKGVSMGRVLWSGMVKVDGGVVVIVVIKGWCSM